MHTYPKSSTKPAYTIRFSCLGALANWLKSMDETTFNGYFMFNPTKNTATTQSKKQKADLDNQDLMWAKAYFANLKMDDDKRYNRDAVVDLLITYGYGEDFKKVPKVYWTDVFKTEAVMKPETIYKKLSMLRAFFEVITLDTEENDKAGAEDEEPKTE